MAAPQPRVPTQRLPRRGLGGLQPSGGCLEGTARRGGYTRWKRCRGPALCRAMSRGSSSGVLGRAAAPAQRAGHSHTGDGARRAATEGLQPRNRGATATPGSDPGPLGSPRRAGHARSRGALTNLFIPGRLPQKYRALCAADTSLASIMTGLDCQSEERPGVTGGSAGPRGAPAGRVPRGQRRCHAPAPALTSRKREMSLLSLTPMATTFSKSQKKGRSSPSLGRASCRRR